MRDQTSMEDFTIGFVGGWITSKIPNLGEVGWGHQIHPDYLWIKIIYHWPSIVHCCLLSRSGFELLTYLSILSGKHVRVAAWLWREAMNEQLWHRCRPHFLGTVTLKKTRTSWSLGMYLTVPKHMKTYENCLSGSKSFNIILQPLVSGSILTALYCLHVDLHLSHEFCDHASVKLSIEFSKVWTSIPNLHSNTFQQIFSCQDSARICQDISRPIISYYFRAATEICAIVLQSTLTRKCGLFMFIHVYAVMILCD